MTEREDFKVWSGRPEPAVDVHAGEDALDEAKVEHRERVRVGAQEAVGRPVQAPRARPALRQEAEPPAVALPAVGPEQAAVDDGEIVARHDVDGDAPEGGLDEGHARVAHDLEVGEAARGPERLRQGVDDLLALVGEAVRPFPRPHRRVDGGRRGRARGGVVGLEAVLTGLPRLDQRALCVRDTELVAVPRSALEDAKSGAGNG